VGGVGKACHPRSWPTVTEALATVGPCTKTVPHTRCVNREHSHASSVPRQTHTHSPSASSQRVMVGVGNATHPPSHRTAAPSGRRGPVKRHGNTAVISHSRHAGTSRPRPKVLPAAVSGLPPACEAPGWRNSTWGSAGASREGWSDGGWCGAVRWAPAFGIATGAATLVRPAVVRVLCTHAPSRSSEARLAFVAPFGRAEGRVPSLSGMSVS
jgi:hypothetical protein